MSTIAWYWGFNRLSTDGKTLVEEKAEAKIFIQEQCLNVVNQIPLNHSAIQRHLFALFRENHLLAEICLRCFISEQIKQACINLELNFGKNYQFSCGDLFPFVLDDTLDHSKRPKAKEYTSMSTKILQTFEPERASLATWTNRLVRYEPNLNRFLLECGLYLVSDWAILNDTSSKQLRRILKEYHYFNDPEISQACLLLEAYHRIYTQDRLAVRKAGVQGKCLIPSSAQLQRIAEFLGLSLSPEKTLTQLNYLAEKLREYRIFIRGGKPKQDSLDYPDISIKVEQRQVNSLQDDSEEQEQQEFLSRYRQKFLDCLEQAIAQIVPQWLNQQKESKKQEFLTALKLFHCQGYSMSEIASNIGFKAQYQVTRLMQLKNFRSDIRQQILQDLRPQILEMATNYTNPAQLCQKEQQVERALEEQVTSLVEEDKTEASMARNQPLKSIFAQSLCRYLDQRENSL